MKKTLSKSKIRHTHHGLSQRLPFRWPLALMVCAGLVVFGTIIISLIRAAAPPTPPALGIAANAATVYLADQSPAAVDDYFSRVAATGSKWVRFRYDFNNIEPSSGQYNWSRWDDLTTTANKYGLKVLGILIGAPSWAVADGCDPAAQACAPRPVDFGAFAGAAATRYSGAGTTGKVDAWEIWNEPNCGDFYPRNPATYAGLVKAAYGPIKAGASGATVLAGGSGACITDASKSNWNTRDWLIGMYAAGAHGFFDGLTHHPYCWVGTDATAAKVCPLQAQPWSNWTAMYQDYPNNNSYSTDGRSLRSILKANGDTAIPIWLTEFGAPTATQPYLSSADQERQLRDATTWLTQQPAGQYGPLFWYELADECAADGSSGSNCGSTEGYYGLTNLAGAPKTAYNTFKTLATQVSVTSLSATGTLIPGATVKADFTLQSISSLTPDRLIVAARNQAGANFDFPDITPGVLSGTRSFTASRALPAGTYTYWVSYYKNGTWTELSPKQTLSIPAGTGLAAKYYDNSNFTGTLKSRTDAAVNFAWGTGVPITGIAKDTFSVRWTGKLVVPETAAYTFYTNSDDGMRLWVNGKLLVDDYVGHAARIKTSAPVTLTTGQKYDIKVDYFENTNSATAQVLWSSSSISRTVIPQTQLYPN